MNKDMLTPESLWANPNRPDNECKFKAGLHGQAKDIFSLHHLHPTSPSEEPPQLCHLCCNTTEPPPRHESHPTPRIAASLAGLWTLFLCRCNLGLKWEVLRGVIWLFWSSAKRSVRLPGDTEADTELTGAFGLLLKFKIMIRLIKSVWGRCGQLVETGDGRERWTAVGRHGKKRRKMGVIRLIE